MAKHKGLSAIHLTMMALGTVVGGSFFLGSVVAIKAAGPAVIISYVLGGILVYFILFALSEMTVADPQASSFRTFAAKAYGPSAGFVVGWVYWTGIVLAMSSEAIAISILLKSWLPGISVPLTGTIIIILITLLNMLGADKLSKLESGLAAIKILAIVGFIVFSLLLIFGISLGASGIGMGALQEESWFPGGIAGIAGSMLIVMFAYAGFEIISLAASETNDPQKTVPRAIFYTVVTLIGLYVIAMLVLLPLVPVQSFSPEISPLVFALTKWNLGWVGWVMNIVLITAIFSTMLAAMFGLGRMIRSLADEGQAPAILKERTDIPYRGILFSGAAMLGGLLFGFILPDQVYIFLVSSGGFSLLFTYLVILLTHLRLRKTNGCPPEGKCQLPGYPYTSWMAIVSLLAIILSMPLIPGQGSGLIAGIILVLLYLGVYSLNRLILRKKVFGKEHNKEKLYNTGSVGFNLQTDTEASEELTPAKDSKGKRKN